MIGSHTKIAFLTIFFAFAFSMMFFALLENYTQASDTTDISMYSVVTTVSSDIQSLIEHEIIPDFGQTNTQEPSFDFYSDDSLQKYISDNHPFNDLSYVPSDLLPIDSNFTANNSQTFKLREEAGIQFADMARHFRHDFSGDRLYIASAYRSRSFQDYLVRNGCSLLRCAKPGSSEHQAGLAVDLKVITRGGKLYSLDATHPNKYFDRLKKYAADFGFHNTYQKGIEVDGKMAEGRHRRYLGKELATILAENNQTFTEYFNALDTGLDTK